MASITQTTLKQCPFCGPDSQLAIYDTADGWRVTCYDCGCTVGGGLLHETLTKEQAVVLWNIRNRPDHYKAVAATRIAQKERADRNSLLQKYIEEKEKRDSYEFEKQSWYRK